MKHFIKHYGESCRYKSCSGNKEGCCSKNSGDCAKDINSQYIKSGNILCNSILVFRREAAVYFTIFIVLVILKKILPAYIGLDSLFYIPIIGAIIYGTGRMTMLKFKYRNRNGNKKDKIVNQA